MAGDCQDDFEDINDFISRLPQEIITSLSEGKTSFEIGFEYVENENEYALKPRIKIFGNLNGRT